MARNKSEKITPGFEHLNQAQLEHMRNEALFQIGALPSGSQYQSWRGLLKREREELMRCANKDQLRQFYKDQHRAQNKT